MARWDHHDAGAQALKKEEARGGVPGPFRSPDRGADQGTITAADQASTLAEEDSITTAITAVTNVAITAIINIRGAPNLILRLRTLACVEQHYSTANASARRLAAAGAATGVSLPRTTARYLPSRPEN